MFVRDYSKENKLSLTDRFGVRHNIESVDNDKFFVDNKSNWKNLCSHIWPKSTDQDDQLQSEGVLKVVLFSWCTKRGKNRRQPSTDPRTTRLYLGLHWREPTVCPRLTSIPRHQKCNDLFLKYNTPVLMSLPPSWTRDDSSCRHTRNSSLLWELIQFRR